MERDATYNTPSEVLSISSTFNPQTLIYACLAFVVALIAVLVLFRKKRSQSRGNTFLLVGPSDAGKTSILSQLAYGHTLPTQTSMQANLSTIELNAKKAIQAIDIPGHPRLRNQFQDYLPDTKVLGFVVDASTVSRNAPAVAEHLHLVLHALTSLPPSQAQPMLVILAHKSDLFKTTSTNTSPTTLAINRVKAILERELEKRRASQSGGVNIEGLGEEGERSDMGGLECGESTFKFDEWEGGEIAFLGTSVTPSSEQSDEKNASKGGLDELWGWLEDAM